jgi:hypothetical protein|tara:strand:+ start:253 stop:516 length:264 start_codon:yes stop_codon:yes gene_type:complete
MTQKERIVELEAQLAEAQRNTYVTDTHTLWAADNELYIQYGEHNRLVVFDIDALYPDLSVIIDLSVRENKKNQASIKDSLKEAVDQL